MHKHQPIKMDWELQAKLHKFLTLTLGGRRAVRFKYQRFHTLVQTCHDIIQFTQLVWKCGKIKIHALCGSELQYFSLKPVILLNNLTQIPNIMVIHDDNTCQTEHILSFNIYYITNFMQPGLSSAANSSSTSHDIPFIL